MLAANFDFYSGFVPRTDGPEPPKPRIRFDAGTPDAYEFFLHFGQISSVNERLLGNRASHAQIAIIEPRDNDVGSVLL